MIIDNLFSYTVVVNVIYDNYKVYIREECRNINAWKQKRKEAI